MAGAPGFAENFFKAKEFLPRSASFASFQEAWMNDKISRRQMLKSAASSLALAKLPGLPLASPSESSAATAATNPTDDRILPLTSTSGVFIPPRGGGFFKFSFDFPEPSVSFEGFQFAFRLYTFENAYTLDRNLMTVEDRPDGLDLRSSGLVWAGGQEKAPGQVHARLRKNGSFLEWDATCQTDQPIKSVAAIIRGVPRGKIAAGGGGLFDPKDNELLFGYPFGGGSLFVARGMDSPVAVVQSGETDYWFLSVLLDRVRANRFYFQPGENSYRVELIYELGGWEKSHRVESPVWRVGRASSLEEAYRPHFEHVESAFQLPAWETREDVPAWLRRIALIMAVHGMHWTGYIFNDFAKTLRILEWVKMQIPAENVLVFLPAWDGRYYWNYPSYQADPRLGGEDGFRALIHKGQSFGFRFMPMFGLNSANRELSVFSKISDAATSQIDGDAFNLNWVDWDNDRHNEGWAAYMNIGVESWRQWLFARIRATIERYGVDAYFLDIAGGWENNRKADMHEGLRRLVGDLRKKFPNVLCCGEMSYDALLSFIPLYHVFPAQGYPGSFVKYARAFQHLSHPAPGRGSSGVHESGFGRFDSKTLSLNPRQIPTITVVDDTFDGHRDVLTEIIAQAKQRAGIT